MGGVVGEGLARNDPDSWRSALCAPLQTSTGQLEDSGVLRRGGGVRSAVWRSGDRLMSPFRRMFPNLALGLPPNLLSTLHHPPNFHTNDELDRYLQNGQSHSVLPETHASTFHNAASSLILDRRADNSVATFDIHLMQGF